LWSKNGSYELLVNIYTWSKTILFYILLKQVHIDEKSNIDLFLHILIVVYVL